MAISFANFEINKVSFSDPETDSYGNIRVPVKYERNGKEGPVTFNLPIVRTDNNGVTTQANENGGGSHSIKILFPRLKPVFVEDHDPETDEVIGGHYEEPETVKGYNKKPKDSEDPDSELVDDVEGGLVDIANVYHEAQAYADIMDEIYSKAVDHCFANNKKLGFGPAKQRIMVEAQLKNPIYRRQISEEDESEDKSYPPSIYLKFIESGPKGTPANTVYTRFTGVDQKAIHWTTLVNTMMYLVPTMRIECIFLGAKKNIQCKVTSAIVLETKAREEMSNDLKTVQDLIAQNPALLQSFLKSLGGLEKYREVKREGDIVKKPKPVDVKAQPILESALNKLTITNGNEEDTEEDAEEQAPPPTTTPRVGKKTPPTSESPLDNFMKQQTPVTTPSKRVIPRRTTSNGSK